jgi:cytochrome c biogenesis protein CcdA
VKKELRQSIAAWIEGGRKVGFFFALVAGSAALGFLIAWPLWLFATSARHAYTLTVLALAGAGVVYLVVRAAHRRSNAVRDAGRPPRTLLSMLLGALSVVVGLAGVYLAIAFILRRQWILLAAAIVLSATLLWLLGHARGAAKARKVRLVSAEHRTE